MSVAINEVVIDGGPLPQGPLNAYSYDPVTSCVFLTKLTDLPGSVLSTQVLTSPPMDSIGDTAAIDFSLLGLSALSPGNPVYIHVAELGQDMIARIEPAIGDFILLREGLNIVTLAPGNFTLRVARTQVNELHSTSTVSFAYFDLPTEPYTRIDGSFTDVLAIATATVDSLPATWSVVTANVKYTEYPANTSWGYVTDDKKMLAVHMLAPFPPPFFDPTWCNPLDYVDDTTSQTLPLVREQTFASSISKSSTPKLDSVVKILTDIHAKPAPTSYSVALITQETLTKQLLWRCIREPYVTNGKNWYVGRWIPSEKVYKYKAGGIFFGGKDYAGPLNSVLLDPQDGTLGTEYKILDLNEFRVNSNNEVEVDAYVCNYSLSNPLVYCALDKSTGRMAEISYNAHVVRYFTLVVPVDSVIHQLYYTTRLMYTVYNTVNGTFSLYDAHNNGVLLHVFDVGTYDPTAMPQFSIIN